MEVISKNDLAKDVLNQDDVEGFSDYKESIEEMLNIYCEIEKNRLLIGLIEKSAKGNNILNQGFDKQEKEKMDNIIRLSRFKKFLEEHENVSL